MSLLNITLFSVVIFSTAICVIIGGSYIVYRLKRREGINNVSRNYYN